jgi:hypothetical protein
MSNGLQCLRRTDSINLAPASKALLKFAALNLKLIVAELQLLGLVQPQISAARTHSLECIKCAMDVLYHVVNCLAPHRYITYCQDNLAITSAYAGVWLFKVRISRCVLSKLS